MLGYEIIISNYWKPGDGQKRKLDVVDVVDILTSIRHRTSTDHRRIAPAKLRRIITADGELTAVRSQETVTCTDRCSADVIIPPLPLRYNNLLLCSSFIACGNGHKLIDTEDAITRNRDD